MGVGLGAFFVSLILPFQGIGKECQVAYILMMAVSQLRNGKERKKEWVGEERL